MIYDSKVDNTLTYRFRFGKEVQVDEELLLKYSLNEEYFSRYFEDDIWVYIMRKLSELKNDGIDLNDLDYNERIVYLVSLLEQEGVWTYEWYRRSYRDILSDPNISKRYHFTEELLRHYLLDKNGRIKIRKKLQEINRNKTPDNPEFKRVTTIEGLLDVISALIEESIYPEI